MHREALLYEQQSRQKVRCCLCPHRCLIEPSCYGFCGVRYNQGGKLVSLVYGYPAALAVDPIEKKPLYHFLPGSKTYSLATLGCNFKCRFCQNWQISQTRPLLNNGISGYFSAENIVAEAMRNQCESIAYTYSEPTVFFEYVWDIAKLAKTNNLKNVFITNGYISKEAIKLLSVNLDAVNIDLKSFHEEFYRDNCRGSLAPVLETIEFIKESDVWLELTTLLIPGENDSEEEIAAIARYIAGLSRDIPWHISAFHPDYKFLTHKATIRDILRKARDIAKSYGLNYVYLGNLSQNSDSDTECPNCKRIIVWRKQFQIQNNYIKDGKCKFCSAEVSGVF